MAPGHGKSDVAWGRSVLCHRFVCLVFFFFVLVILNGGARAAADLGGFLSKRDEPIGPAPPFPERSRKEDDVLRFEYSQNDKTWPYVGDKKWMSRFPVNSRKYWNSFAVFPNVKSNRMHGSVGRVPETGEPLFHFAPSPKPVTDANRETALKDGGFYLALSDHLTFDRDPPDVRPSVCKKVDYDYQELEDVSVIITFYNEPISTLMRSVHAVLNRTPPPLLREIILVDDHSNMTSVMPDGELYDHVRLLPKTQIIRLAERRGLVTARLAGAQVARAPIFVVLDSHIEVNDGWLEPQLQRLKEKPESIVFPQIAAIDPENFSHLKYNGIGCTVSFKWVMQEKSQGTIYPDETTAIPSPSMAGGLFAVRRDWFWELGGYDEEFSMWGAENVEMPFRAWLCGGRVECTPCAITYHIYRKGGSGYKSPPEALWKNRLRTARLWTGEMFQLTEKLINQPNFDIGNFDVMLKLKERLHCKDFSYFLDNVDHVQSIRSLDNIRLNGEIRNKRWKNRCVDTLSNSKDKKPWGSFPCHGSGGTQGFIYTMPDGFLRITSDEDICLSAEFVLVRCSANPPPAWDVSESGQWIWRKDHTCLALQDRSNLKMVPCVDNDDNSDAALEQKWTVEPFQKSSNFVPLTLSAGAALQ